MRFVRAFIAGFLSVIVFHQGMLALLHAAGFTPRAAFAMDPTRPFGIPSLLSLAFWGGVWGIILWLALRNVRKQSYWLSALLFGAIVPTLVAWFVVAPLKHQPVGGGFKPKGIVTALLINGAWGLGTAAILRAMGSKR